VRIVEAINALPLAGLLSVVALGYALSRLSVRGISLGPAGATLFVALCLGHLGVQVTGATGPSAGAVSLGALGFALFIYSVGFDAAPHFMASFRERRGFGFVGVAVAVNVLAFAGALAAARAFDLGGSAAAGLLAGALTSTPTYAAAAEVAPDPTALSVAFALTYPFGLVGIVLLVQVLPRLGAAPFAVGGSLDGPEPKPARDAPLGRSPELSRSFEVHEEDAIGRPLRELALPARTGCVLSRVRRGTRVWIPDGETVLEAGDVVTAVGRLAPLRRFEKRVGPEIVEPGLARSGLVARRVEVHRDEATRRTLEQLGLIHRFHCVVTRIERGAQWLEPDAAVVLAHGDVLEVVGRPDAVREAAGFLGRLEPTLQETDLAVWAGGLVAGLLLGAVKLPVFGVEIGLGTAGGLLVAGLLLGWRQRLGPFRTFVPREARQLVRDFGILLFIGETGLEAGAGMGATLGSAGAVIFAAGAAVNAVAVLGALALARRLLGLRPVDAWGSIAGGLTSSAALQTVRRACDSNEVAISYAAAYAVASVLATGAGPLLVVLAR